MNKDHITAEEYKLLKTEHQIQTEIINYLRTNGWYVQRMNTGVISSDYTYKTGYMKGITKSRKLWLSDKGTPDIMAIRPCKLNLVGDVIGICHLIFIEVKRPGNKPTFAQEETMKELERHGARCIVAHSVEELEKLL